MKNQGFIDGNRDINRGGMRGNAIVIILIVIALLGALTLTLTRMGGNTNDMSQEQAQVIASQVLRQAKSLANATDSLLAKGCSLTQLSFENSLVSGYTNVQSPSDKSCWFFDAAGAGLNFPTPPANSNDGTNWSFNGRNVNISGVGPERETGVGNTGTDCSPMTACQDVVAALPVVNISVCKAVNFITGITTSFNTSPPNVSTIDLRYKFSATVTPAVANLSSLESGSLPVRTSASPHNTSPIWDKKAACIEVYTVYAAPITLTGGGIYVFYQVLVER